MNRDFGDRINVRAGVEKINEWVDRRFLGASTGWKQGCKMDGGE